MPSCQMKPKNTTDSLNFFSRKATGNTIAKKIRMFPLVAYISCVARMTVLDKLSDDLQNEKDWRQRVCRKQRGALILYIVFLLLQPSSVKE